MSVHGQLPEARPSKGVSVAHEINNSIDAVLNLLYLLENEITFTDTGLRLFSDLREEVARIAEVARQTLAENRNKAVRQTVYLDELVNNVLSLYSGQLESKNVTVHRQYRFKGGLLLNPTTMRELFANLILNATDALPVGGIMILRISERCEWSGRGRRGVRVLVADNGYGIKQKYLHRIFLPFFTTKGSHGSGIGLSIVQETVQEHGGVLKLRSSDRGGKSGTVFSIFLPHPTQANS